MQADQKWKQPFVYLCRFYYVFMLFNYFAQSMGFFSPFFNFSGGSKPKLYANITLVIVSAVTTAVFIAFCIVLGLLIIGNVSSVKQ